MEKKNYIRRNWLDSLPKWANYAREHSPLLLQATTTNPIESFHSALKRQARLGRLGSGAVRYSLAGLAEIVTQVGQDYFTRAKKSEYDWSNRKVTEALSYPWLSAFPYAVQLLLVGQIRLAEQWERDGEPSLLITSCDCKFARAYALPCAHVIYAVEFVGTYPAPDWTEKVGQFEESGFEFYWSRDLVCVEPEAETESRAEDLKLTTNEILDNIRTRFFDVKEYADSLDPEARDRLLGKWEATMSDLAEYVIGGTVEEWVQSS